MKLLFSIPGPNLNGFKLSIQHLKALPKPVKMRYCDQKSIDVCKSYEVKSVRKLLLSVFTIGEAAWSTSDVSGKEGGRDISRK